MSKRDWQGVAVALMVGAVAAIIVAIYLAATWGVSP